jgi:membrane protein DedA with SNARE-associated domain
MHDLINDLGGFIARNAVWAGPILGLVTFGESMVVIGAFFPATALMVIAGGLAAAGVLHPAEVLLWCLAGAIIGDAVSYWLGLRTGPVAWRHPLLKPRRRLVARARLFFKRYGVLSIILCRFLGPVRAFVPFIAGVTRMAHLRFQVANIVSALIWVPVMLAPGYLAGKGFTAMQGQAHSLEWTLAFVVALVFLALAVRHALKAWRASQP